ncbi:Hypothetical protein ADU72_0655 [Pediococcus damnosus]|uniref:Uncharacterized protein n=1 Tax=Pediococcus damnosus TaxID=51663 RepID=A0A143AM07_9LACO|nr:hypothetical protein [Pediococcus damnosus]AMV60897.1 Hypothetical protein ADU69_1240 [Pediococcus damnosus]AMV63465.1 Hypothetical protein ADU70_1999 [Pediococcus damnosus]AMV65257.1 Hypothetical protein ADU71_1363 [Pediococcus damnosus]AMV66600.1 Hypothetical protein ADU72_0655 [Pediococcus damnosus]AMV68891.1 Hypothetical protein ADU73_0483 [Pediococcus damnosus]
MKINSSDLLESITGEKIERETFKITSTKLKKDPNNALTPVFSYLQKSLKKPTAVEATVTIKKDVLCKFQTNIINLPYNYPNKIEQLTNADTEYDLQLYAIFEAEDINASHLRIDLMGTVDDFLAGDADVYKNISDWMKLQFEKLEPDKTKQE